ncbi:MAG: zinc metalloprotease HtpX [Candidatus Ryanbacteria bacterium CG10_big_fil_rev_8_21_14_0_10_43_42]|uniref:Protease HtpX homolog n=1 Tax=Candidatus Ryanbacteria bacterium CG10_big_fil_rev_8_21_14_0_10_43_42 TaxID=1974864 RepID=A0A2M8KXK9_9BACT|nr:MAG: zinc metalloprotease HtpX [Candidatus Ryanbacteria bacterium CG10_big_fil_rev_8_21_14_0_10_43_42]
MATLYTHQSSNIRKTWLLFTVFFIVVIALGWVFTEAYGDPSILIIAVVFSIMMSIASFWYSDTIILRMTHARPVTKESARELYNIVENLSITAGLPVPKIYIIDEPAPNAFATGRNAERAVVAVTTGLLDKLDRSELEGVLAHELSHIGNRDMLVSTVSVILVGFIALISDFFLRSMFWRNIGGGDRDRGQAGVILMLAGIVLAILSPIIASLMQLAISRKREFLADASGALLTRYPDGLARALEKISRDNTPLKASNNALNHLWLADPEKKRGRHWFASLFMTHPPIEERIRRLRLHEVKPREKNQ